MVSAEGGTQHSLFGFEKRGDQHPPNREAVAHTLGRGNDVGPDAGCLMGEEIACAAISRLYLIEDHRRLIAAAQLTYTLKESIVGSIDAGHSLDPFDQHCCHITFAQLLFYSFQVVKWRKVTSCPWLKGD